MTKKSQTSQPTKTDSTSYYIGRILQRIALCVTITLTATYWAALITGLNNTILSQTPWLATSGLRATTLTMAALTAAFSLALLAIPRFRKYDKPFIVDGVVVALFCFASALVAQSLVYSPV